MQVGEEPGGNPRWEGELLGERHGNEGGEKGNVM
jgi:hypothetical protein